MKQKSSLLIFILLIFNALPLFALPEFKINTQDNFLKIFPANQHLELAIIKDNQPNVTSSIDIVVEDNQIKYQNTWPEGDYTAYLGKDLSFKKAIKKEQKIVKTTVGKHNTEMPYNYRVTEINKSTGKLEISYFLDEIRQAYYEVPIEDQDLDMDLIGFYCQALLHKKQAKPFSCQLILPDLQRTLSVDVRLKKTKSLSEFAGDYALPEQVKKVSALLQDAVVFIIEPKGFSSLFYPHKFYLFYQSTPPYNLLAWWGGAPKEVLFFISNDLLVQ